MSFINLALIAFSLALDAGVVSVGAGALNRITWQRALLIAFVLAAFHALMPVLGWGLGYWFRESLLAYGRIIGFVLILGVGFKMLKDALDKEEEEKRNILDFKVLLILAFATSIDALVIGFTFNFLEMPVTVAALTIGVVTFVVSLLGTYVGGRTRHHIGKKIEVLGAIALILLAFKVLLF